VICKKGLHEYVGKQCKECKKAANKNWAKTNPQKVAAKTLAWYKANPDKNAAKSRAWYRANPDKRIALNAKRYAAKLQRTLHGLTKEHYKEIYSFYKECKKLGSDYCVDHIIPLQGETVSGLHVPWNLQILTKSENSRKSNSFDGTLTNNSWAK
jgi:5-methylcytosine-specific restriction endonuclease McrA